MHKKTLEQLEFYRVRDEIANFCASEESAQHLKGREPLTSDKSERIEELKGLCREWNVLLQGDFSSSIKSWPQIHTFLKVLSVEGASLEQEQFYSLLQFCASALTAAEKINTGSKSLPIKKLLALSEKIDASSLSSCSNEISRIVDPRDGSLKDIPALRAIKEKISQIQKEIASALKKYTSDPSLNTALESSVPVFRADRQLLAVKASHRLRVPGIVHELSKSGQTLFIEPDEAVRKNNELIQEEFHLEAEKRKIFTDLTAKTATYAQAIKSSLYVLEELDETCAAAKWGLDHACVCALPTNGDAPLLLQARHPLLGEKAVPIDMKFLPEKNVLIVSGPNTGGKTVTLKTFALLSLLNQAGFPIPAAEGSRLPLFDSVFCDIGDEQSIDQSLSTFSAHMKNIAAACRLADSKSLVLLDELGSGTDPQEGGAIGMAALDSLIAKGAFVLVTTHHGILKNYAYTSPKCANASVEFDGETLSPTYRLLMGVPGESHALEIAKRSGLPRETVEKAKNYLSGDQADVSVLIKNLTQKHAELAKLEREAKILSDRLAHKELKIESRELALKEMELEIKKREKRSESDFVRETRRELENLVRYLREGEITKEKTHAVRDFIDGITQADEENDGRLSDEEIDFERKTAEFEKRKEEIAENGMKISKLTSRASSQKKTKSRKSNREALSGAKNTYSDEEVSRLSPKVEKEQVLVLEEGAEVLAGRGKTPGRIIRREKKGVWLVQVGSLKMPVKEKDLIPVAAKKSAKADFTVELSRAEDGENAVFLKNGEAKPVFELRLLGMREEEAIKTLQRQLDLCQLSNFKNFSVIHGKGNGILQQAVQDYLSSYPGVKAFHFARPEDGGSGKTYVELN